MVQLKRTSVPRELSKTNKEFKMAIAGMDVGTAYTFFEANKDKYKYNTSETKKFFKKMNSERCSFCTRFISDFDKEMTVEHIRLKRTYPKGIYQWNNLLCSCKTCNTTRSIKPYEKEKYLDPTKIKDIEKYFCYMLDGTIVINESLSEEEQKKAIYMRDLYGLNRPGLVVKRREFMKDLTTDDGFFEILSKKKDSSQNIIFLSAFTYYRRCKEQDGE